METFVIISSILVGLACIVLVVLVIRDLVRIFKMRKKVKNDNNSK